MTGGGFGGCTVNLVAEEDVEKFHVIVASEYERATSLKPEIYICTAANGAEEVF
jgi:galactokinase